MRHLLLTFFIMTMALNAMCQEFQGTVVYQIELKNPMPQMISDSVYFSQLGGRCSYFQIYYYKGTKYKSEISEMKSMQLYDSGNNTLYNYKDGSDSASWIDCSSYGDKIKEIVKLERTEEILGVSCEIIVMETNAGKLTYYFSDNYKISPERFTNHKYGFWEDYLKETGALPLKMIQQNAFMNMTITAVKIKRENLSDKLFEKPEFTSLTKSLF